MTPEQWAELLKRLDPSAMVDHSDKWVATDGEFDVRVLNRIVERVKDAARAEGWDSCVDFYSIQPDTDCNPYRTDQ